MAASASRSSAAASWAHGIAQVFAAAGPSRRASPIRSPKRARDRCDADRRTTSTISAWIRGASSASTVVELARGCVADADFVIEAAPEDLELKQADLRRDRARGAARRDPRLQHVRHSDRPDHGEGSSDKARALGTHWWNPPYLVPLVEVIRTAETSDAAVAATIDAAEVASARRRSRSRRTCPDSSATGCSMRCGAKRSRSSPKGVCDAKTVDDVVKSSFGARLAVLGPLENADLVGTDLTRSIHGYVLPALDRSHGALALSRSSWSADGRLGFKSGEGFRKWTPAQQAALARAGNETSQGELRRAGPGRGVKTLAASTIGQGHHHLRGHRRHPYADDVGRPAVHARRHRGAIDRRRGGRRLDPASARARSEGRAPDARSRRVHAVPAAHQAGDRRGHQHHHRRRSRHDASSSGSPRRWSPSRKCARSTWAR